MSNGTKSKAELIEEMEALRRRVAELEGEGRVPAPLEQLAKLSRAVEQTADAVVITDRQGVIEYVNRAFQEMTGYAEEEAIGRTPRILKSGIHPAEFYQRMWATILSGQPYHVELVNRRKDGTLFDVEHTITPLKGAEGDITHFVSVWRDITARKRAEAALREAHTQVERQLKELQARDGMLEYLLYLHRPEETLAMAVQTALDLCAGDAGALYLPDAEGGMVPKAAVGFGQAGVPDTDLSGLTLAEDDTITRALQETAADPEPVLLEAPVGVWQALNVHSVAILPICRGEAVLALLVVARKRQQAHFEEGDLAALEGFLSYVAMAVADWKLQEEHPDWTSDVDEILRQAEEWTE